MISAQEVGASADDSADYFAGRAIVAALRRPPLAAVATSPSCRHAERRAFRRFAFQKCPSSPAMSCMHHPRQHAAKSSCLPPDARRPATTDAEAGVHDMLARRRAADEDKAPRPRLRDAARRRAIEDAAASSITRRDETS